MPLKETEAWYGGGLFELHINTCGQVVKALKNKYNIPLLRSLLYEEYLSLLRLKELGFNVPKVYAYSSAENTIIMEYINAQACKETYKRMVAKILKDLLMIGGESYGKCTLDRWLSDMKLKIKHYCNLYPVLQTVDFAKLFVMLDQNFCSSLVLDDWNWQNFLFCTDGIYYIIDNRVSQGDFLYNISGIMMATEDIVDISTYSTSERYRIYIYILLKLMDQYEQKKAFNFDTTNVEKKIKLIVTNLNTVLNQ